MPSKFYLALTVILSTGLAFVITDCSCGERDFSEVRVNDKEHTAAWTEVNTYTDSEGRTKIDTIHHPETWSFVTDAGTLPCSEGLYSRTQIGDVVTATCRVGRWTKWRYLLTAKP